MIDVQNRDAKDFDEICSASGFTSQEVLKMFIAKTIRYGCLPYDIGPVKSENIECRGWIEISNDAVNASSTHWVSWNDEFDPTNKVFSRVKVFGDVASCDSCRKAMEFVHRQIYKRNKAVYHTLAKSWFCEEIVLMGDSYYWFDLGDDDHAHINLSYSNELNFKHLKLIGSRLRLDNESILFEIID